MHKQDSEMGKEKEISVIMPTYNTPIPILREAVESILNQTYTQFEFIIINDGSTNGSSEYLESINDSRIIIINNTTTLGIPKSLNIGINASKGNYIARMDADDISLPTRLEMQIKYMKKHSDVMVCGTNFEDFGIYNSKRHWIIRDTEIRRIALLFSVADICHPTVMIDRKQLMLYGILYNEEYSYAQDYGMWVEVFKVSKIVVMKNVLLKKRSIQSQISIKQSDKQRDIKKVIQRKELMDLFDNVTEKEIDIHYAISHWFENTDLKINNEIVEWSQKLISKNNIKKKYNKRKFAVFVYENYLRILYHTLDNEKKFINKTKLLIRYYPKTISGILAFFTLFRKVIFKLSNK